MKQPQLLMPSNVTAQQYGQAVLDHVQTGAYPESEEVIATDLPPSALPDVSSVIQRARSDLRGNIKVISRECASDIDGWISQAKQLRLDIQNAEERSRAITEQARHGEQLEEKVKDAANKVDLLNVELAFSKSLANTLERLQGLWQTLDQIQQALLDNQFLGAVDLLIAVDEQFPASSISRSTRVPGLFESKTSDARTEITGKLTESWKAHIHVETSVPSIQIRRHADSSPDVDVEAVVQALNKLEKLDEVLLPLCRDLEMLILLPRLQISPAGDAVHFDIQDDKMRRLGTTSDLSAESLFSDLCSVIQFLHSRLPSSVFGPLGEQIMPRLIARLISTWLASAVPENLDGMEGFQDTLSLVRGFADALQAYGWPGHRDLMDWINGIPNAWIRKRQEMSLVKVRKLLSEGIGKAETVERVETQTLPKDDQVFAEKGGGDDWNADWSDDEGEHHLTEPEILKTTNNKEAGAEREEEDVSAWGLDEEKDDAEFQEEKKSMEAVADDADAWGWGDENQEGSPTRPPPIANASPKKSTRNGVPESSPRKADQEITLKETYNISLLPREILKIILQIITDSGTLESAEHLESPIASVSPALLSLPGLILAMFRAGSSNAYAPHPSGSMFLYNDSLWLSESLQTLLSQQQRTTSSGRQIPSRTGFNLNLTPPITSLQSHGKCAYAKEMESQRTIIIDLLDGAQGFMHCTEYPFNQECDIAIASTVDRLRQLHKSWKAVLSHSALLQSLGSLLSTICSKIIVDIEDMSDISEPESQQMTTYCSRIVTLEDLFMPDSSALPPQNEESVPLTAVYTPAWLKFQYLANILESSLVDIKYLWTEGELGLEFETEELVDLVLALFADSPHRRTAVGEIRAARR